MIVGLRSLWTIGASRNTPFETISHMEIAHYSPPGFTLLASFLSSLGCLSKSCRYSTILTYTIPFLNCSTISVTYGMNSFWKRRREGHIVVMRKSAYTFDPFTSPYLESPILHQVDFSIPLPLLGTFSTTCHQLHCATIPAIVQTRRTRFTHRQPWRLPKVMLLPRSIAMFMFHILTLISPTSLLPPCLCPIHVVPLCVHQTCHYQVTFPQERLLATLLGCLHPIPSLPATQPWPLRHKSLLTSPLRYQWRPLTPSPPRSPQLRHSPPNWPWPPHLEALLLPLCSTALRKSILLPRCPWNPGYLLHLHLFFPEI